MDKHSELRYLFDPETVFQKLRGKVESADLYQASSESYPVFFKAGKLKSAESNLSAGAGLRLIKNGKVGFASTNSPNGLDSLIARALNSASFGDIVSYTLPLPPITNDYGAASPQIYFSEVANLPMSEKISVGESIANEVASNAPKTNLEIEIENSFSRISLSNTSGLNLSWKSTSFSFGFNILSVDDNGLLWISDGFSFASFERRERRFISRALSLLRDASRVVNTGKPEIIVMEPSVVAALISSFLTAINGKTVIKGISPLSNKLGERIADSAFSLFEDPLLPNRPFSFPFDDEGTPRAKKPLIEKGVLKTFIHNLDTAAKSNASPTGNGERSTTSMPVPGYSNLVIEKGMLPTVDIIKSIKNGLWIHSVLGAGQSNMLAGDFSLNGHLAYKIENGEITGRVKNTMISGNVYDAFNQITAISSDINDSSNNHFPAIAFSGLSVSG